MDGKYTFYKGWKKSQNDLCICNKHGLKSVTFLKIHEIGWNISDHFPISVSCKFKMNVNFGVRASLDINEDMYDTSES